MIYIINVLLFLSKFW